MSEEQGQLVKGPIARYDFYEEVKDGKHNWEKISGYSTFTSYSYTYRCLNCQQLGYRYQPIQSVLAVEERTKNRDVQAAGVLPEWGCK